MNGKIANDFKAPPFVLRLSKDERRVFQQNHICYSRFAALKEIGSQMTNITPDRNRA